MRSVIVHMHLFKNAGSTVDAIFEKNISDGIFGLEGEHPWSVLPGEKAVDFIDRHPELRVLTSHQVIFPLQSRSDLEILPVFFLRHPIDRAGSVYSFEKRQDPQSPGAIRAKQLGPADYVAWRLSGEGGIVIKNFHVLRLSDALVGQEDPRTAVATREDLERAKRRLEESPFFGIVERFDDSIAMMSHWMEGSFPGIELTYEKKNFSPDRARTLEERVAHLQADLGEEIYARLLESNRLDLELYEHARKLFQQRAERLKQS